MIIRKKKSIFPLVYIYELFIFAKANINENFYFLLKLILMKILSKTYFWIQRKFQILAEEEEWFWQTAYHNLQSQILQKKKEENRQIPKGVLQLHQIHFRSRCFYVALQVAHICLKKIAVFVTVFYITKKMWYTPLEQILHFDFSYKMSVYNQI